MKKHIVSIDYLRVISCFMVMIVHSAAQADGGGYTNHAGNVIAGWRP